MPWPTKKLQEQLKPYWRIDRYKAWLKFYRREFKTLKAFREFANRCLDSKDNRVNITLNIGERLISLADKCNQLAKARPSLQIFFLVVCCEAIIRTIKNQPYTRNISEKSVIEFCEKFFSPDDVDCFKKVFARTKPEQYILKDWTFGFNGIIRYFYRIRCEVAHQGVYWNFHWANDDADMLNFIEYQDKKIVVRDIIEIKAGTTYEKIKPAFTRAVINAAQSLL